MAKKKLSDFPDFAISELTSIIEKETEGTNIPSIFIVAQNIFKYPESSCSINLKDGENASDYITKWTRKYIKGFNNRTSKRKSNAIGTQHDPIIDEIISSRIGNATENLQLIKYGHRLSMSAENIAGSLLEEFLFEKLLKYDWHCCWGETMRSIDFCTTDGRLIQIKNSDNSENSSSKTVRDNTEIIHWFRRFSKSGDTNWYALQEILGIKDSETDLTEEEFRKFVRESVSNNPDSLFLEDESPYGNDKD